MKQGHIEVKKWFRELSWILLGIEKVVANNEETRLNNCEKG